MESLVKADFCARSEIGLLNAHDTLNYHSMMRCENAVHYLSRVLRSVHFVVLSNYVEQMKIDSKRLVGARILRFLRSYAKVLFQDNNTKLFAKNMRVLKNSLDFLFYYFLNFSEKAR